MRPTVAGRSRYKAVSHGPADQHQVGIGFDIIKLFEHGTGGFYNVGAAVQLGSGPTNDVGGFAEVGNASREFAGKAWETPSSQHCAHRTSRADLQHWYRIAHSVLVLVSEGVRGEAPFA